MYIVESYLLMLLAKGVFVITLRRSWTEVQMTLPQKAFENPLHKFMVSKGEEAFHRRYEEAIESIKSEFGRTYTMIIDDKNVESSSGTFVHTSPIDPRIVLAYFPG